MAPKRGLQSSWSWSTGGHRHRLDSMVEASGDVSFVGLCRPVPLSPKREVLDGALAGAVVGFSLYTKRVSFAKGTLQHGSVFVSARRDARVISTWCVPSGEGVVSGEKWIVRCRTYLQGQNGTLVSLERSASCRGTRETKGPSVPMKGEAPLICP